MSWRTVVVTKPSKLDYSMGYMTVRDVENTVKIHLSEVSILIIENTACSITCALLSQLSAKKIKLHGKIIQSSKFWLLHHQSRKRFPDLKKYI